MEPWDPRGPSPSASISSPAEGEVSIAILTFARFCGAIIQHDNPTDKLEYRPYCCIRMVLDVQYFVGGVYSRLLAPDRTHTVPLVEVAVA